MSFDGTEGAEESRSKAETWTAAYRTANPGETIAHFFGRDILEDILKQNNCKGIRIYYGLNNGTKKLLLVGADANEDDLLGEGDIVANASVQCPTSTSGGGCSSSNILNS